MMTVLQTIHVLAALVVLAEALNKLERTTPFAHGMTRHARLVDGLKAVAWALLALGSGCTVAAPLLLGNGMQTNYLPLFDGTPPLIDRTAVMLGFAVLIVRTRIKEG
ncbi:MAG: hypothetical protein Q8M05_13045 [Rhodoferax sp.]|uniref:hypothetical protein n=1 Tax=Rhodoferax sp. TaxID=50421 RepID=UPI00272F7D94|nr:hypothetical protein [Rhodoferax sp.]MDP1530301.1 hypothetical protein [Rhodoferax sp.]MDP1943352.1 hypothetical protein [Rhodoferax sp.]